MFHLLLVNPLVQQPSIMTIKKFVKIALLMQLPTQHLVDASVKLDMFKLQKVLSFAIIQQLVLVPQ